MPIGYWVKHLNASLDTYLDATLARLGLSREQWQVINLLHSGPAAPRQIGDIARSGPSMKHGAAQERDMAALVRNRLIFLLDGRLALTDTGLALHAEAARLMDATGRELTAGIGADEYAMAVSVLERMSHNADRLDPR